MKTTTTKTVAKATTAAVAVAAALSWTYGTGEQAKGYELPLTDLGMDQKATTPAAFYLLSNGFKQSMADSIAGYAKELRESMTPTGSKNPDGSDAMAREFTDAEVHAEVIKALDDRFAAIKAGEVGFGSNGPRLRGVDKVMRDIAVERLRALYIEARKTDATMVPPKGDDWNALVSRFVETNDADLRTEANKRLAPVGPAVDLKALLADATKATKAA